MSEKVRQANFELLRIIAMLMIIGHHLAGHGVQWGTPEIGPYIIYSSGSLLNKITISSLLPGGEVGVACFFLLTGYFQINKKDFSILKIILESMYYGVFSIVLFLVVKFFLGGFSTLETSDALYYCVSALFNPCTSGIWWFVSAYILIVILSPLINNFILKLNKRGFIIVLFTVWALWYSIPFLTDTFLHPIQRGLFFYLVGAFIRIYYSKHDKKIEYLLYATVAIVSWIMGSIVFFYLSRFYAISEKTIQIIMAIKILRVGVSAFFIPICAISIFRLFEMINIGSQKVINTIAATSFAVYLIHDSLIGRNFLWHDLLKVDLLYIEQKMFPLYAVAIIFGIFGVCSVIDLIRLNYFEKWAIQQGEKIIKIFKRKCMK